MLSLGVPTHQSTYQPFHSTETTLLSVHNNLVRSVDNGHVSLLVLLDLSAAFDTVDHQILLSVLSNRFRLIQHTHIHTHVRLLDERLTDRNLNNDTARPNVSFKMQL